jgi:hypothetical protein
VELLSIYKRLRTFQSALGDERLPSIDREYLVAGKRLNGVGQHTWHEHSGASSLALLNSALENSHR